MTKSRVNRFTNLILLPTKAVVCHLIRWKVPAIIQHSASSSRCVYPPQTPERVRQVGRQHVSTKWPGPPCFLPSNKVFHFCNLSEDRGKTSIEKIALSSFADTLGMISCYARRFSRLPLYSASGHTYVGFNPRVDDKL